MSAGVIFTIRCDHTTGTGEACDREWFAPVAVTGHRELRRHLKECGWGRTRSKDFCPDHAAQPARRAAGREGGPGTAVARPRTRTRPGERGARTQEGASA
ncbi:hypothetical protein ACFC7A_31640 [Streptomyces niveus]|uniref:hypothetical protein n=1 Tax=Streptomyces niveus TaxID=193462 RepID=UPI0035E0ADB3